MCLHRSCSSLKVCYTGFNFTQICNSKNGSFWTRYYHHFQNILPQNKLCLSYQKVINHHTKMIHITVPKTGCIAIRLAINDKLNDIDYQRNKEFLDNNYEAMKQLNMEHCWSPTEWADLTSHGPVHIPLINIHDIESHNMQNNNYFIFGFVRNPYSRLVSAWKYLTNNAAGFDFNDIISYQYLKQYENFHDFIRNYDFRNNKIIHLMPQCQFFYNQNNDINDVNFIGKFENFYAEYLRLCDESGINNRILPQVNKSQTIQSNKDQRFIDCQYGEWYDSETSKIVQEAYYDDFVLFGYDM